MNIEIVKGKTEYFPGIEKIRYEGPHSKNSLSFKYYDENRAVGDKTMKEHLRFSVAYWHSFCGGGSDPFGDRTLIRPWDAGDSMEGARRRLDAAFEFISKLGAPFYCFHDRDLAPEGGTVAESEHNLKEMTAAAMEKQKASGVRLLWGTANLFSHPRYMNGAMTNPDFRVVAHAAAQVKAALEATVELGGENFVFWGGREGYSCLYNTDMKRELEHMAVFLGKARDYGRSIGFKGNFLIEPKPMEPMKHQYDTDAAVVIGFLRHYGLDRDFRLNIENNHATLAGKSFAHELQVCADCGMLGSIDANQGDPQNGWDTDEFPTDIYDAVDAMLVILGAGGLGKGGLNFDAHVRRNSTDPEDLFLGHIGGMDAFARALLAAHEMLKDGFSGEALRERYSSFDAGDGARFEKGELGLLELRGLAASYGEPAPRSGRQEYYKNMINDYIFSVS